MASGRFPPKAAAARELKQNSTDAEYLEERWDELIKGHRDQWVGVYKEQLLFGKTLEELFDAASERHWDLGVMVVERLADRRPALLL